MTAPSPSESVRATVGMIEAKLACHGRLSLQSQARRCAWARNHHARNHPLLIDETSLLGDPSWLKRFDGRHPSQVQALIGDARVGVSSVRTRPNQDLEQPVDAL